MCFFKKKKKKELVHIDSKYQMGEMVRFRHKGEIAPGYVYAIHKREDGLYYDIQIGGECPAIIEGIKEETIIPRKTA